MVKGENHVILVETTGLVCKPDRQKCRATTMKERCQI